MVISTDLEKNPLKKSSPFIIKAEKKVGIEGMYLNILKAMCDKPKANIILMGKTETISSKVWNDTRCPSSHVLQYSNGIPTQSNKAKERNN
jgi:hypothetical protein